MEEPPTDPEGSRPAPAADDLARVVLPHTEAALALARECSILHCLGAIAGIPGTGKTTVLRSIVSRHESISGEGRALYVRATRGLGATRGTRDLLEALGLAPGLFPPSSPAQHLKRLALHHLRQQNVRLICVDEADGWSPEAFQTFVGLYDHALSSELPLSAIFAGSTNMLGWLKAYAAGMSRTLRCETFVNLSPAHVVAVLRQWNPLFGEFATGVSRGDKESRRALTVVMRNTGGNLRRLSFFARLFRLHFPDGPVTTANFEIIERLLMKVDM